MAKKPKYSAEGKDYVKGQGFVNKDLEFDLPGPPSGKPVSSAGLPISKAAFDELKNRYKPGSNGTQYVTFSREAILTVLAQYGCAGIKFYFVERSDTTTGQLTLVMAGVDDSNNDLTNTAATLAEGTLFEDWATGWPPSV